MSIISSAATEGYLNLPLACTSLALSVFSLILFDILSFRTGSNEDQASVSQSVHMAGVEVLPNEYGYVLIVLLLYVFLNSWMGGKVSKARKRYNVPYPKLYASESENKDANAFNCIQRGHQNSLELMPIYFALMLVGGIHHPLTSAAFGLLYVVSRYFYFTGYSTGIPENRIKIGKYGFVALMGLMVCTVSFALSLLRK